MSLIQSAFVWVDFVFLRIELIPIGIMDVITDDFVY